MDILLKYVRKSKENSTGQENYFHSLKDIQEYFLNINKNNNYIFFNRETTDKEGCPIPARRFDAIDGNSNIVKDNDKIFFLFEDKIIATALYVNTLNPKKDDKFTNGYKVTKVRLVCPPIFLNTNPFNNQNSLYYLNEKTKNLKGTIKELKEIF